MKKERMTEYYQFETDQFFKIRTEDEDSYGLELLQFCQEESISYYDNIDNIPTWILAELENLDAVVARIMVNREEYLKTINDEDE
jgi:hypothetical protein